MQRKYISKFVMRPGDTVHAKRVNMPLALLSWFIPSRFDLGWHINNSGWTGRLGSQFFYRVESAEMMRRTCVPPIRFGLSQSMSSKLYSHSQEVVLVFISCFCEVMVLTHCMCVRVYPTVAKSVHQAPENGNNYAAK